MNTKNKATNAIDGFLGFLFALAGALIVLTVILVCGDVLIQWITGRSLIWVQETVEFSLVWLTFLGASFVLKEGGHIKMDLIVGRLSRRARRHLECVMSFAGGLICLIMLYYSAKVTMHHAKTGYKLMTYMAPPSAAIDFIVPLGFLLLSIQFLRQGLSIFNARSDQCWTKTPSAKPTACPPPEEI